VIESDCPEVLRYARSAYARLRVDALPAGLPCDRATILAESSQRGATFNGRRLPLDRAANESDFTLAFYGTLRVFVAAFAADAAWLPFFAAALRIRNRAVLLAAPGGTGKTTLTLALLDLGAKFYSDEFAFVRRADRFVSGCARTLHVREPALAYVRNPKIHELCAAAPNRIAAGGWPVWDFIDPAAIYGDVIFAEPAPLGAVVLLERAEAGSGIEPLPGAVAAAELAQHYDGPLAGFRRTTEIAATLAGVPAYRLKLGDPTETASALFGILG
jgi:hypothetical protein